MNDVIWPALGEAAPWIVIMAAAWAWVRIADWRQR